MAVRLQLERNFSDGSQRSRIGSPVAAGLDKYQRERMGAVLAKNPFMGSGLDGNLKGECARKLHFPVLLTRSNLWFGARESLTFQDLIKHRFELGKDFTDWDGVFSSCIKLKKLNLSDVNGNLKSPGELAAIIESAKRYYPNIEIALREEFIHSFCAKFDVPLAVVLQQQLNTLQMLTVSKLVTYQKLLGADSQDWDSVFRHCKELKILRFSPALEPLEVKNKMISIIESAGRHCKLLPVLDLGFYSHVDDELLACIAINLPNLTSLNLQVSKCTRNGIKSLIEGCRHLTLPNHLK